MCNARMKAGGVCGLVLTLVAVGGRSALAAGQALANDAGPSDAASVVGESELEPYRPDIAPPSEEGELSMRSIQLPSAMQIDMAAAEPELANPVAMCFDRRGRLYVAETFRQDNLRGVEDNRAHMDWLNDDLAARTVEDRRAYLQKHLGARIEQMTQHHDRVRQLRDTDADGRYESSTVFADGFNDVVDGTAAGLLSVDGDIWLACIPNLWRLRDHDGDGRAEEREILHHGFGVRFAFRGHDLHGLTRGPDGRIYFSVGDRGYHVVTDDATLADAESGAVFRCEADGSDLEVFATGLRNPQELAFNRLGDLFTGDNNSDSGDQARWVHLVEGSDSGWRMAYQYLSDRGPFNREQIWHPYHDGQPAFIVPPIANVADGPGGLVYNPGTGLPAEYDDMFLLCDFRGTPGVSGIRGIQQRQKGATYELANDAPFIWKVLATDCEFGPDGSFYILDWVSGWTGVGKGRIYRASSTDAQVRQAAAEAARILTDGFDGRPTTELATLLAHPNMRVRLEAQFALAAEGELETLRRVATDEGNQLGRLHAIWGLGQIARREAATRDAVAGALRPLLDAADADVRAMVARTLSDLGEVGSADQTEIDAAVLVQLQKESHPRVLRELAITAGRLQLASALTTLLGILDDNNDRDPVLRHAAVMGLAGSQSAEALVAAAVDASAPQRMGIALALRRQRSPLVARFLRDNQARIAEAAARAIYDTPIPEALQELAATLDRRFVVSEPFIRRALAANYRLGGEDSARRVVRLAGSRHVRLELRLEALQMLQSWAEPSPRDWILGMWRPIASRGKEAAVEALEAGLPVVMADRGVRSRALRVAGRLGIEDVGESLVELLSDTSQPVQDRRDAVLALRGIGKDVQLAGVRIALSADEASLRAIGLELLPELSPQSAMEPLSAALGTGSAMEKQAALAGLAKLNDRRVDSVLRDWLDRMIAGQVETAVQLDLLEAAAAREDEEVGARLGRIESQLAEREPIEAYAFALEGGDAAAGEDIFLNKTAVSCSRCHSLDAGEQRVGPVLAGIGKEKSRRELLEALLEPNKTIAKGFETVVLTLDTGKTVTGIVLEETNGVLRLVDDQREEFTVSTESVEDRFQGQSAMPDDVAEQLTRGEIRDLVEFLAGLQDTSKIGTDP